MMTVAFLKAILAPLPNATELYFAVENKPYALVDVVMDPANPLARYPVGAVTIRLCEE